MKDITNFIFEGSKLTGLKKICKLHFNDPNYYQENDMDGFFEAIEKWMKDHNYTDVDIIMTRAGEHDLINGDYNKRIIKNYAIVDDDKYNSYEDEIKKAKVLIDSSDEYGFILSATDKILHDNSTTDEMIYVGK